MQREELIYEGQKLPKEGGMGTEPPKKQLSPDPIVTQAGDFADLFRDILRGYLQREERNVRLVRGNGNSTAVNDEMNHLPSALLKILREDSKL